MIMRGNKFRAWDGAKIISLSKAIYNDFVGVQHNRGDGFDLEPYYDNVELMQYTGLKDSAGNEIYEGDIIKFKNKKGWSWVFVIEYNKDSAGYMLDYSYKTQSNNEDIKLDCDIAFQSEVIGNMYEDEQLLEGDCDAS